MAVLRTQPILIVDGRADGGYVGAFELICCECGDNLDLDYSQVSPRLQQIRGPYTIAAGLAAYEQHLGLTACACLRQAANDRTAFGGLSAKLLSPAGQLATKWADDMCPTSRWGGRRSKASTATGRF